MNYNNCDTVADQRSDERRHRSPELPVVTREEVDAIFQLCRADKWREVLVEVNQKPWIALTPMVMDNHISTTIIHQAITSKSDTATRAEVIASVLTEMPQAASIRNGYGSLPLHVICQRNTKMDSQTKERLVFQMVTSYAAALLEQGGVGKRTPLHIIFTDYISPRMTRMMIDNGPQACFMKDKKGLLPAHVACMRHCSPDKLRMLLAVHPGALVETTNAGETLLMLATDTATKAHPNYALIDELNRQLTSGPNTSESPIASPVYHRNQYEHHPHLHHHGVRPMPPPPAYRHAYYDHNEHHYQVQQQQQPYHHQYRLYQTRQQGAAFPTPTLGRVSSEDDEPWNHRGRLDSNDSNSLWSDGPHEIQGGIASITPTTGIKHGVSSLSSRKRKASSNPDRGVDLLLHFSRKSNGTSENNGTHHDDVISPEASPKTNAVTRSGNGGTTNMWGEHNHHTYAIPDRVAEV